MSGVEAPARHLQQELFGRVLDAWAAWEVTDAPARGRLSTILDTFGETPVRAADKLKGDVDIDLAEHNIWLVGPPIQKGTPNLFPVATAGVWEKDSVLNASIRVALIALHESDETHVWGWRFDSAEQSTDGKPVPRPHAHSQPISRWFMTGIQCLLHPHQKAESGAACSWQKDAKPHPPMNETHPAFPLRGDTLPGLAVAFIASLYGAQLTRTILETDPAIERKAGAVINEDMARVLGGVASND